MRSSLWVFAVCGALLAVSGKAAALKEKGLLTGKRVGLIASGGNVDHDVFADVLMERDR